MGPTRELDDLTAQGRITGWEVTRASERTRRGGVRSYWSGHAYIRTDDIFTSVDGDPPDSAGQEACVACLLDHVHQHLNGGAS